MKGRQVQKQRGHLQALVGLTSSWGSRAVAVEGHELPSSAWPGVWGSEAPAVDFNLPSLLQRRDSSRNRGRKPPGQDIPSHSLSLWLEQILSKETKQYSGRLAFASLHLVVKGSRPG